MVYYGTISGPEGVFILDIRRLARECEGLPPLRILFYPEVDSTKEAAARMVRRGGWRETLILADYQAAGKGTHGRTWHAPPGSCLLVSLLLRPRLGLESVALGRPLAEAIIGAVHSLSGLEPVWEEPNDVFLGGRKLAGVLVESTYAAGRAESWILSFGLNVSVSHFPDQLRGRAASLHEFIEPVPSRETLLGAILGELRSMLAAPPDGKGDPTGHSPDP